MLIAEHVGCTLLQVVRKRLIVVVSEISSRNGEVSEEPLVLAIQERTVVKLGGLRAGVR